MDKPEVLVHISTPATRANDNLYRSLADAYLAFESYQPADNIEDEAFTEPVVVQSNRLSSSHGQAPHTEIAIPTSTSMDSYGSFPSYMTSGARSSDPNVFESPGFPDSSEVSISRLERLEHIQAKWREQRTPRPSFANSRRHSTTNLTLPTEESIFIENTQQAYQDVESQLPDDLSATSEEASGDDADIESVRTPFTPSSGNHLAETRLDAASDDEQSTSRKILQVVVTETNVGTQASQQSSISITSNSKDTSQTGHKESPSPDVDFEQFSLVVTPPPPKITVESPGTLPTQITRYLGTLKLQNPGRFKPKTILRALEADERGHWRVDCNSWPKNVQHQFWSLLAKDISIGRLGWGVTLHREPAHAHELGLVRMYCWGEIVEHVWLSLWLHSRGKINGSGSAWVDGGEVEVVTIP